MSGFVCWLEGAAIVVLFVTAFALSVAGILALVFVIPVPSSVRGEKLAGIASSALLAACVLGLFGYGLKVAHDEVCARGFRGAVHYIFAPEKRK